MSLQGQTDDAPSLAARFAVREATMKALGVGLGAFDFHDVAVHRLESGAPVLHVSGRAQALAHAQGVDSWHVSITHTDSVAMAVVAALEGAIRPIRLRGDSRSHSRANAHR
jgi:holo-[acyl-carrier protein] synthase